MCFRSIGKVVFKQLESTRKIFDYLNSLLVIFLFVLRLYLLKQVCNDVMDCLDGSDECLCQNHVHIKLKNHTIDCVSQRTYCEILPNLTIYKVHPQVNCSTYNSSKVINSLNPIELCMIEHFEILYQFSRVQLIDFCKNNCSSFFKQKHWSTFCKLLSLGLHSFPELICKGLGGGGYRRPGLESICDGKVDCVNGADEEGCPGRLYCYNHSENV